jgi:hypothetical protein
LELQQESISLEASCTILPNVAVYFLEARILYIRDVNVFKLDETESPEVARNAMAAFEGVTMKRLLLLSLFVASNAFAQNDLKPLRAGIIGLDTSHVPAFTKLFNKG